MIQTEKKCFTIGGYVITEKMIENYGIMKIFTNSDFENNHVPYMYFQTRCQLWNILDKNELIEEIKFLFDYFENENNIPNHLKNINNKSSFENICNEFLMVGNWGSQEFTKYYNDIHNEGVCND